MTKNKAKVKNNKVETLEFSAEVDKLLHLVIHSLYTNKEIFLRELLSNSSDACDKLRYEFNINEKLSKNFPDYQFKIEVELDKKNNIITISDNGIGMSHDELIANLGTIAKSGTQNYIDALSDDQKKNNDLIGQFGVGFYSAFMIADKIQVVSNKIESDEVYMWESNGKGKFTVEKTDIKHRGTKIILYVNKDEDKYLDKFHVKHLITTYSDHVTFPIELKTTEKEDKPEIVNSTQAIWSKNKAEVTKEEHNAFYKSITNTGDDPWLTIHNKVEGVIEYTNLLYIPSRKPFDLFHPDRKCQVKLYVKKIFVTEDNVELIPSYLRFLRGVVDSQDLPLNVSRETLQNNLVIDKIRNSVIKKVLSELKAKLKKDPEAYLEFWNNFGAVLKEGLCEYTTDKEKLLDLCLFRTSKSGDKSISLKEYVDNMQKDQGNIYYLIGSDYDTMQNSPQIEAFKEKDIEILFLTDGVDDFWLSTTPKYQDKLLKTVTKVTDDLDKLSKQKKGDKEKKSQTEEELKDLIAFFKETLKDSVSDVKISHKLTTSPVCLAVAEHSMDIRMERILLEQGQIQQTTKKILEINATHKVIAKLNQELASNKDLVTEYALNLFDQACIVEGEAIKNPTELSKRITNLLEGSLKI